ncbi:MAG: FAD-dependent thymidylate synthase [Bacillota bacterium]|nr:FAD-dependent thymidylate synthase [Bacillota bacterium]
MRVSKFETTGLQQIAAWIERNNINRLNEKTLREALRTINIFFVAEGIDRVQSMLLCELKASYVQQSQRYVTMDNEAFAAPILKAEDNIKAASLINKAYKLYEQMSELATLEVNGRPKKENYLHKIPIEDARYILPLCTKTNICVSMSGDKLYDLFYLFNSKKYEIVFKEFKKELGANLPFSLFNLFSSVSSDESNDVILEDLFLEDLEKIDALNNMKFLRAFGDLDLQVGLGALTSTQKKTPSQTLAIWGDEASIKAKEVSKRVLGYGHESIAEQARTTFGMMCSLAAYHQQIRHRLPEIHREDLLNLILDLDRPILVPKSIEQSIFHLEYLKLADEFKEFRLYVYEKYGAAKSLSFLVNCDQVKFIISTNARIDSIMLAERTCMNSQWEIRDLATKKLNTLRTLSTTLYEKALPSCVTGKCKEGKLTCGKQAEVKVLFNKSDAP